MRRRLSTLAALAIGASCLFVPATAHAADANQCWTNLQTGESKCFDTFAEVVADLSGGKVAVGGNAASFSAANAAALDVEANTVTIGIVYENWSYTGSSNTYVVSTGCDTSVDVDYQVNLTGTAWDNRISSFKSYSNCETKLWAGVYTGVSYGWYTNSSQVATAMNDQASSIQWR